MKKDKDISIKDLETWEEYIKNPKDIYNKEIKNKETFRYNRFRFDLHGYTLLEANNQIDKIVTSCFKNEYREILLITGKGLHSNTDHDIYASKNLSKLRYSVPDYIKTSQHLSKLVHSIEMADKKDGGDGAILIKLKKSL